MSYLNYIVPKDSFEVTLEVLKSRFIGVLRPIETKDDVTKILEEIKIKYPKARHYCYAYKIFDVSYASGDGEPHNTFSKPVLEMCEKLHLNCYLIIVVRYFGGTLLGASRLLRTYLNTVKLLIDEAKFGKQEKAYLYEATLSYENLAKLKAKKDVEIKEEYHLEEYAKISFLSLKDVSKLDLTFHRIKLKKEQYLVV